MYDVMLNKYWTKLRKYVFVTR